MYAIVEAGGRLLSVYTHIESAMENCTGEDCVVVPIPAELDPGSIQWNATKAQWDDAPKQLTAAEAREQSTDPMQRRVQMYAQRIDTGVVNELVLDLIEALSDVPEIFDRLRPSSKTKFWGLMAEIASVKAAHPK